MDASKLLGVAHRFFASEANNAAWTLAEAAAPTDEERDACVAAAYASLLHWRAIGPPLHVARAHCTVARALLVHGAAAAALSVRHAELALAGAGAAWEEVFALATLARARAALGQLDAAASSRGAARTALGRVTDAEDREACERELGLGPWFGLD